MVLRCSEIDGPLKSEPSPPSALAVGSSFSVPFDNPMLRWGGTRILRCQLVSGHRQITDRRRPSSTSPLPPPPPPQTKNDPSPPSSCRPRLVLCIPYRPQPKEPERDGPPAPEERRDHRQEMRPASSDWARVEIARLDSGPMTRSLRSRAGAEGEKKTAKKVKLAEFNISLSKEEIVGDFIAITGTKPPRRPKDRSRPLHKKLHVGFLFFSSCSWKI